MLFNWVRPAGSTLAAAALAVSVTAGSAAAGEPEPEGPVDTGGEYVRVPLEEFEDAEPTVVEACGTTLSITDGDVRELEFKIDVRDDGSVITLYRGGYTIDIVRESDGALLDELPNDGPGFEYASASGRAFAYGYRAPGAFFAFDDVEAAAYEEAGLPDAFFLADGYFEQSYVYSSDPEVLVPLSTTVEEQFGTVLDLCDLLDRAGDDGRVDGIN